MGNQGRIRKTGSTNGYVRRPGADSIPDLRREMLEQLATPSTLSRNARRWLKRQQLKQRS